MISLKNLSDICKDKIKTAVFNFISGGANEEITLRENAQAYDEIKLLPRVLNNAAVPQTNISILDKSISMPVMVAPMAFQRLVNAEGELAVAKAVSKIGTIMQLSIYSTTSLSQIKPLLSLPPWFQIYILKDRGLTKTIIQFAEQNGCDALVITVDTPVYGKREREIQNPINVNLLVPIFKEISGNCTNLSNPITVNQLSNFLDPTISWADIEWVKSITKLPIFLKGILREDDALIASSIGVRGIIISNHGGRQLDTAVATIKVLPQIAQVLKNKIDIFIDGGITKGTDILKALSLGAKAVLIGRPVLLGLALDGQKGVFNVLNILHQELKLAMTLCGCDKISAINSDLIYTERNKC